MNDLSGQTIGRYQLIEKLGEGGMAIVYKAFDTRLECEVAVKVIRMERLTQEMMATTLKRFEREAKAVAKLNHPNIVNITDYGEHEGVPYLVMEYLRGGTLKEMLGKPITYTEAARLLTPVASALQYAHEHNVIHRDVKPSNILITESGAPMLTDFGIARILDLQEGQTLTGTGVGIGTPEYMAPEQWTGNITPAVDIYSLGVVFYELVTGHKPYTADTPAAVFLKQATEPLPRPSSFTPGLPERVEQVIYKAMAKKAEDRYSSMQEFESVLQSLCLGSEGVDIHARNNIQGQSEESPTNEGAVTAIESFSNYMPNTIPGSPPIISDEAEKEVATGCFDTLKSATHVQSNVSSQLNFHNFPKTNKSRYQSRVRIIISFLNFLLIGLTIWGGLGDLIGWSPTRFLIFDLNDFPYVPPIIITISLLNIVLSRKLKLSVRLVVLLITVLLYLFGAIAN